MARAWANTLLSYSVRFWQKLVYASAWAGSLILGSLSKSWIPKRICLIVMAGLQSFSSSKIERQTVPDGETLGWNSGGTNLTLGGVEGKSSLKIICPR